MDQKIALLAGLCAVADGGNVSSEMVRDLRDILSLFVGEVVSEDDYQEITTELKNESYIQQDGDTIIITREGLALSQSIFTRLLGQTNVENFNRMLADYRKAPEIYLRQISPNIKSLQDRYENKTKEEDLSKSQAVGFILEIEHKNNDLFLHRIKIKSDFLRDDDALTKEINASAHRFSKTTGFPVIAVRRDDAELELISFTRIKNFKLFSEEIEITDIQGLDRKRVSGWNEVVASLFLEQGMQSFGYIRAQWPGRSFIKFRDYHIVNTNLGDYRECPAFELDIQELTSDKVCVWLNSYTSPSKRLVDFIKENFKQPVPEELLEVFSDLRLRSIPSGSEIQVKSIFLAKDVTKEKIPGIGSTYAQFWKDTYGIELGEKIQPVVVVQGRGTDFHYPVEMLFIDKYSFEKYQRRSLERKTRTEAPRQRAHKSESIVESLKQYRNTSWDKSVQIRFVQCNPTLEYLHNHGALEGALRVHQPTLEFRSGAVSLDPSNIFKGEFGAKCGHKTIAISHFFVPSEVTNDQIDIFIKGLQKTFSSVGFGNIHKSSEMMIVKFNEKDKADLENKIRELDKVNGTSNHLGVLVIPPGHPELYFTAKRLFPSRVKAPIQVVQISSFIEAQDDRFRGFRLLSLKILIKSLRLGEAIWTLSNNAGLLPKRTLYVGVGFSASPREGKVSKCATVLHDSRGNKVSWKVFATVQTRTVTKQWFDTLLHHIRDIVESEKPERLIFYRTGSMFPVELDAINLSLAGCAWIKPMQTCFVSILDGDNHRFFLAGNYKNLPAGYAVVKNATEGLISSSNYDDRDLKQGTVVPVRLKLEIGNDSIVDILKEYHDLTYLNWLAPYTTSKHPLLLTIAEKFAELTRENISSENMFYLDL
jgi:hypothetical protein